MIIKLDWLCTDASVCFCLIQLYSLYNIYSISNVYISNRKSWWLRLGLRAKGLLVMHTTGADHTLPRHFHEYLYIGYWSRHVKTALSWRHYLFSVYGFIYKIVVVQAKYDALLLDRSYYNLYHLNSEYRIVCSLSMAICTMIQIGIVACYQSNDNSSCVTLLLAIFAPTSDVLTLQPQPWVVPCNFVWCALKNISMALQIMFTFLLFICALHSGKHM